MTDTNRPRQIARQAVQGSVAPDLWKKNRAFSEELKKTILSHRLVHHPLIGEMDSKTMSPAVAKMMHLEFGHAFAQIFTDSVVRAMFDCSQVEPRCLAVGKVGARFLLQLNLLDELGFVPGDATTGEYAGSPLLAHYVQFDEVTKSLGVSEAEKASYKPHKASVAARKSFEDQYGDYVLLTGVLAVAEQVFTKFAGPWARSTNRSAGVDISKGYHAIHVEDAEGGFLDDDHSEDSWYVFSQAVEPARYDELRKKVVNWLDVWAEYCDAMGAVGMQMMMQKD